MDDNQVSACPVCGLPLPHSCYHDGESVPAKSMGRTEAIRLLGNTIEEMEETLTRYREALAKLHERQ